MVVEITTFQLAAGVDESAFVAADAAYQAHLMVSRPGFVRRTVARDGQRWAAVALWWSDEEAMLAETSDADVANTFRSLLAPGSIEISRYTALEQ